MVILHVTKKTSERKGLIMGCFYVAKCRKSLDQEKLKSMKSYKTLYDNQPAQLPNPRTVGVLSRQSAPSQLSVSLLDLYQVRRGPSDGFPSCTAANPATASSGSNVMTSNKGSPETVLLKRRPVPLPLPQEARHPLPLPLQRSSSLSSTGSKPQFKSSKTFQSFSVGSEPQPLPLPSQVEATSLRVFGQEEILAGCENFSPSHWLRDTRIGSTYRCTLKAPGSQKTLEVAVTRVKGSNIQDANECLSTFETLAQVQSPFVSKFLGFCMPKETGQSRKIWEWLLVSEHVESKSLETFLKQQDQSALDWPARMKIAMGIARGLEYLKDTLSLQGGFDGNFDLSDIQVDKNCNPKLLDYGLQHLFKQDIIEDPDISKDFRKSMQERLAVKNIGKLLFALVLPREYLEKIILGNYKILQTIRPLLNDASSLGLFLDPTLMGKPISGSMKRVLNLACHCLQDPAESRPQLQEVLEVLSSTQDTKKTKSFNSFKAPALANAALGRNLPLPRTLNTKTTAQKMFELPQRLADDHKKEQSAMGGTQIPLQPRSTNASATAAEIEPTRTPPTKLNYRPLRKHTQMPNLRCSSSLERHELGMNLYRENLFQAS